LQIMSSIDLIVEITDFWKYVLGPECMPSPQL